MRNIFICMILLIAASGFGQVNLVPNFSFEQYDTCPNAQDQIQRSIGWQKFCKALETPDYFNSCAAGALNVPNVLLGYQQDKRNCSAFAGLLGFFDPVYNYREIIGIELNQPLIIGQKYYLSFNTVMAEQFFGGQQFGMPSSKMGLRLSTVAYNINNPCPIDNFAHICSATVIDDSINWNRISGSIIADSAYKYLMVGNFYDDLNTDTIHYNCSICSNYSSYYYVDDICLSTDLMLCNGGIDNMPCNVGIVENIKEDDVSIYPNPASDIIEISFLNNQDAELYILDLMGNIILRSEIINKKDGSINISSVASGCYLLQILNKRNGTTLFKKIIII